MRSKVFMIALLGMNALLGTGCSVQRTATEVSSSRFQVSGVESVESVKRVDSVKVEQHDTLREVTTITIQTNDKGDTLMVVQITDRGRFRERADVRSKKEEVRVVRDTVYIERRDSVLVKSEELKMKDDRASPLSFLKVIFGILVCVIILVLTFKVKSLFNN